jgi:hypothetical protein
MMLSQAQFDLAFRLPVWLQSTPTHLLKDTAIQNDRLQREHCSDMTPVSMAHIFIRENVVACILLTSHLTHTHQWMRSPSHRRNLLRHHCRTSSMQSINSIYLTVCKSNRATRL